MSFVSPIFALLGLFAIAVPIVIHLLNRRRYKTVEWAAMTWLLAAAKQNRRRMRFESWLLLALRALAVLLVGLALARPLGLGQAASLAGLASQQPGLHVLVVDDSYSMSFASAAGAETNFARAKAAAKKFVVELPQQGQQVAVITASSPATVLLRPTLNLDAAVRQIETLQPGFGKTDLTGALRLAKSMVEADAAKQSTQTTHLFTDASGESLDPALAPGLAVASKELREVARIAYQDFSNPGQENIAVLSVGSAGGVIRPAMGSDLKATAAGFGRDLSAQLRWKLDDQPLGTPRGVELSPSPAVQIESGAKFTTGGLRVVTAQLTSNGSSTSTLTADDARSAVVEIASGFRVLIVEGRRGLGPLAGSGAFLRLALAPPRVGTDKSAADAVVPDVISDLELANKPLGDYRTVILAGVGQFAPETVANLKTFVEAGGGLIVFMGEATSESSYNQTLVPAGLLPGKLVSRVDAPADKNGFLFEFNPASPHPLLSIFRDTQRSGLDTAQTFSYFRIAPDPKLGPDIVLKFAANPANQNQLDPAILLHSLGFGRVVTVTTSADAEWSALVAKTGAYVALVHELLAATTQGSSDWLNLNVGDSLVIPPTVALSGSPQLVSQTSSNRRQIAMSLDRSAKPALWRSDAISEPGVYLLSAGGGRWPVAVNIPAAEADVRPIAEAEIRTRLGDIEFDYQRSAAVAPGTPVTDKPSWDDDRAFDFGWPLMLGLFALLGLEATLAHRFGRPNQPTGLKGAVS